MDENIRRKNMFLLPHTTFPFLDFLFLFGVFPAPNVFLFGTQDLLENRRRF